MIIIAAIILAVLSLGADGAQVAEPMPWITGGGLGTVAIVMYLKLGSIERSIDALHDDVRAMGGWPPVQRRRRGRNESDPPPKGRESDSGDSS